MKAATNGHMQICQLLVEKGADPFLKDNRGLTADMLAQIYQKQLRRKEAVEILYWTPNSWAMPSCTTGIKKGNRHSQ